MGKIRIGILGTSEIAFRRFLPALKTCQEFEYVGVATRTPEKGEPFVNTFGGCVYDGYDALLSDESINAVYVPLPPALHYQWAKRALERGKHIFVEKPATTTLTDTTSLIELAAKRELAVHENYMFQFHSQLAYICQLISDGEIGDLRLIRIDFGFPFRGTNDFRYHRALGGGALLDCGGYTVKLAAMLLGEGIQIVTSRLNTKAGFDVDMYGSATLVNNEGLVAQVSFGMDNSYKCELALWGSTGTIYTNRILTAPAGFEPTVIVRVGDTVTEHNLPPDDCIGKSILSFADMIIDAEKRKISYQDILDQAYLIQKVKEAANEVH